MISGWKRAAIKNMAAGFGKDDGGTAKGAAAVSDLMRLMKGRSSLWVQREFPQLKKRYWGKRFWGRGYFSTTNGAITEDVALQYLEKHIRNPTGESR